MRRGDGGFNTDYSWHLDPSTIEFPDQKRELCDGTPSDVERNVEGWIARIRYYCPSRAQFVNELGWSPVRAR